MLLMLKNQLIQVTFNKFSISGSFSSTDFFPKNKNGVNIYEKK